MKYYKYYAVLICTVLLSCGPAKWESSGSILLGDITPIGLDIRDDQIWISDGDNNRMAILSLSGEILDTDQEVERPMHLEVRDGIAYVPSYGSDAILMIGEAGIDTLDVSIDLEAPAGVSVEGDHIAIADFYNNRIVLYNGTEWNSIGEKGRGELQFNYPTDVQISGEKIFVADAYNNRIQILDLNGGYLQTIGADEGMNAATGIYIDGDEIYITDFEHDRVLIFDQEGRVLQIIEDGLNKPTDVMIHEAKLYITNYKGKYISIYEK